MPLIRLKIATVLQADWLLARMTAAMAGIAAYIPTFKTPAYSFAVAAAVQKVLPLHRRRIDGALIGKNVLFLSPSQYPILAGQLIGGYAAVFFSSYGFHFSSYHGESKSTRLSQFIEK